MDDLERIHLRQLIEGKENSLVFLVNKYGNKVYYFALRLVGSPPLAEEIVSDVFLRIWQKRITLNLDLSFSGLLFKIARDRCISELRKIALEGKRRTEFIEYQSRVNQFYVEDPSLTSEQINIVEKAIEKLTPRCKEVFKLYYYDKLQLKEISDALGISKNTVKVHMSIARNFIRTFLVTLK